jgi:hypothetical protein
VLFALHIPAAHAATLPALPQAFVDTTMPTQTGATINVPAGGDLQAALNSANLGDTIVLQAGATFTGPFTLPNKSGSGWIILRSSNMASLPSQGTRVTSANAPNMPKIMAGGGFNSAFITQQSAHHYRFVGLEITNQPNTDQYYLMQLGGNPSQETQTNQFPNQLIIDRSDLHKQNDNSSLAFGIGTTGYNVALVDSEVSNVIAHTSYLQNQTQAFAMWGIGPYLI